VKALEMAIAQSVKNPDFVERVEKMEVSVQYLDGAATSKVVNSAVKGFIDYKDTISELIGDKLNAACGLATKTSSNKKTGVGTVQSGGPLILPFVF
tara:strand:+ start:647 stop:934 length:288 start_codon:yes stop_codon:yes gene_type:complete